MYEDIFSGWGLVLNAATEEPWDLRGEVWSRTAGSLASDGVYMKTELPVDGINHYLGVAEKPSKH